MFNLLKRIYPALINYPKAEKYALAQDTKNCIFQYLNYISRANAEILNLITKFVEDHLRLRLNENKTKIFPINQGVNAIGYKIYATHMLLRNDSKKKIKRKIRAMPHLILEGRLPIEKAEQMLNSWKGHAEHGDSYNFIQSLLKRFKFIYLVKKKNGKTAFKINAAKLKKEGDEHVVLQKREVACM